MAQVIPDVIDNVLDTVAFAVEYDTKELTDGTFLRPSEAAVGTSEMQQFRAPALLCFCGLTRIVLNHFHV